jgi:hypothetical protein
MTQIPNPALMKLAVLQPKCPTCRKALKGMNVAGMALPVPAADGKSIEKIQVYVLPCCPHCGVVLGVQLIQEQAPAPPEPAVPGLWTPPGRG